ncbi:MAG: HRDC domain-containing protein [Bacteroidales bacterium]|jgi:superfamily II DNA helicase RecQ|nr:HRDC domain-containing protein [Bacteroidales bacterium]
MQIKIINIPLTDDGTMQAELNRSLASLRVLEVEQRFFQNEKGGCWSFCIRYITGGNATHGDTFSSNSKEKVDYKQVLSEKEFAVFSALREIRKQIAANDGMPAYAVFTDEELAGIARLPKIEAAKLIAVKGIGDKKVQKYGKQLAEMYAQKVAEVPTATNEANVNPTPHEASQLFT